MEFLELKNILSEMKIYRMRLMAGYTRKISELGDIKIETIWNNGQNFSKFNEKYKLTGPRIAIQLTQCKHKEKHIKAHHI